MSFEDVVTMVKVCRCNGCGVKDAARRGGDGEFYPPEGWRELPTGEHACSGRCADMIRERKRAA